MNYNVPITPSPKVDRKLERFADWVDAWALRIADNLFGPRIAEKLFGPHPAGR